MGRSIGSAAELERTRRLAVERVLDGHETSEVAQMLGVRRQTVSRWVGMHRHGRDLAAKPHPGRPEKLSPDQERKVLSWISRSPVEFGFPDQLWTAGRINHLISTNFGVRFNTNYLSDWFARRRVSPQKPQKVASERNERRAKYWLKHTWPRLKKSDGNRRPPCPD